MLTRRLCPFVFMFSLTCLYAQTQGTVKGVVVNEIGKPVTGAEVYVLEKKKFVGHRPLQVYETDSIGQFLATNLPWGVYVVMAGKESEGYPDMKLAFYSNLAVPTVTLSPEFPSANVNVQLGPKAGILEVTSLVSALNGKKIEDASITLRRVQNPDFFITTSTATGAQILVPSMTDIAIEVSAPGYRTWPTQNLAKSSTQIHLKPEEVYKLQVRLEPGSVDGN
jgi:hypothetical protein